MDTNMNESIFERGVLRRFPEFMKGSGLKYLGSVFSVAMSVLTSFLTPLLIAGAVDAVTDTMNGASASPVNLPGFMAGWFDARGGAEYLARHIWIVALMVVAVSLVGGLFQYLRGKWSAEASEAIAEKMRTRLYRHLLDMDYDFHVKAQTGDLIQRCTTDVDTVRRFLASQVIEIFRTVIMVVLALWLMASIHVKLTLISLILIPPLFGLAFWFFHWVQKLFRDADEADGALSTMLQESLSGVRVVRAFGRQRYESDRFNARADDMHDKNIRISYVMATYWAGSDMLSMLQTGMTLLFGILYATRGEITTGNVLTFVSYISMLIWPIRQLGRILQDLGKSMVAMRRCYEILDAKPESDTPGASEAPLYADIEFRHVSFNYDSKHPVLKDVSFTAKAGQTVAILGATGSGKSTMMNLLQRLYDVSGGEITIGERNINTIEKKYLRSRVGYVLQEPFLYSRSIRDNLAITEADAPEASIQRAADITRSSGFIGQFKEGYDTMVGERGVTLSGGQKQRIAIARTLLRDNDILILDDSLSAVDTETDAKIRAALKTHFAGSTVILISHRITTLSQADTVLVLDKGRIAEMGSPDELRSAGGIYQQIYEIQTGLAELQEGGPHAG